MCACRGLAITVRDEGSVSGVQFTNISIEALFFERSWKGAAEPIHITAMPRTVGSKVCDLCLLKHLHAWSLRGRNRSICSHHKS